MSPLVVIVSGPPGTGKTTLARRIGAEFQLPVVTKDGIKETLFDTLGWHDRAWSRRLGLASYGLLYYFIEALLAAGRSHVVESNFSPVEATSEFLELREKHDFATFQLLCSCKGEVLAERFRRRSESSERHPGHVDQVSYAEMKHILLHGRLDPLDIGGTVYELDTTSFETIDYSRLLAAVRAALAGEG